MIFYLLPRREWENCSADELAIPGDEGYVHCCAQRQIIDVRRRYLPADQDVVALAFDPTQLTVETRYEPGAGGEAERFPHVYGVLRREWVAFVRPV